MNMAQEMFDGMVGNIPEYKFALREDLKDKLEFLPTKTNETDTGWDVRSAVKEKIILHPFDAILIDLGFRAFCPPGYWFELKPRSSSFAKKHLNCLVGTIDESYGGSVMLAAKFQPPKAVVPYQGYGNSNAFKFKHDYDQTLEIEFGERIGQIIPVRRQEMIVSSVSNEEIEELYSKRNAERKDGGFGSSGNK